MAGRANRRRKRISPVKRLKELSVFTVKAAVLITAVPTLFFGGWFVYDKVLTSEYLEVKGIAVSGNSRISEDEIVRISGLGGGQNILSADLKGAQKALAGHPWIKGAIVKRDLPDKIVIEVSERSAVLLASMEGLDGLYVVDLDGVLFKRYSPSDSLDLPVVTGLEKKNVTGEGPYALADNVLGFVNYLKDREGFKLDAISEIHLDDIYGMSLYTLDAVRIDMGLGDPAAKLRALDRVVAARGGSLGDVASMDVSGELSGGRGVVVELKTAAFDRGGEVGHGEKG
jgi:cell division protein FtsQ